MTDHDPDIDAFRADRRNPQYAGDDNPDIEAHRVTPDSPVRGLRRKPTTEGTK